MKVRALLPRGKDRAFFGLELGKIVEFESETKFTDKLAKLVYSGTHTVWDMALDAQDRLFFFDASYVLKMLTFGCDKSVEICKGELWGNRV